MGYRQRRIPITNAHGVKHILGIGYFAWFWEENGDVDWNNVIRDENGVIVVTNQLRLITGGGGNDVLGVSIFYSPRRDSDGNIVLDEEGYLILDMAKTLKLRRQSDDLWVLSNPVLAAGEIGIATNFSTYKFKIGDGTRTWNQLSWSNVTEADLSTYLTESDLSNYYTKSQVDTLLADKLSLNMLQTGTSAQFNALPDGALPVGAWYGTTDEVDGGGGGGASSEDLEALQALVATLQSTVSNQATLISNLTTTVNNLQTELNTKLSASMLQTGTEAEFNALGSGAIPEGGWYGTIEE